MVWATRRRRYLVALALSVLGGWIVLEGRTPAQGAASTNSAPPVLTAAPGSPFSTGAVQSASLSYSPDGRFVAVANRATNGAAHGSLTMFAAAINGALSQVADSPVATVGSPNAVAFDPQGGYLAVADAVSSLPDNSLCGACVSTYSVASDGSLSAGPLSTAGSNADTQVESIAFNPGGNVLVASTATSILTFSDAGNGDLSLVGHTALPTNGIASGSIVFSPDGKLLAVADSGNNAVDLYSVSGASLTFLSSTASGQAPSGVAFNPAGDLLAAANPNSSTVSLFTVGASGLIPVAGSPFTQPDDPSSDPVAVAFSPAGWLVVVAGDGRLTTHAIGPGDVLEEPGTTYDPIGNIPASPAFSPSGQFLDILDTSFNEVYSFAGLAPPVATILSPPGGGSYTVGQSVPTTFSCADSTGAPGLASCTDSNGATSGTGALSTSAPGSYTYAVTAVSQDGLSSSAKLTYTVSPATSGTGPTNPSPGQKQSGSGGPVTASGTTATTTLRCTGAASHTCSMAVSATVQATYKGSKVIAVAARGGKAKAERKVKTIVIGSLSVKLRGGTKKTVRLTLNRAGRALVNRYRRLPARVRITEGTTVLRSQRVTFKRSRH